MKLRSISLLLIVTGASLCNAWPTKVLVKNETQEPQAIRGDITYTAKWFSSKSGSKIFSYWVDPAQELSLSGFFQTNLGTVSNAVLQVDNKPIDLGNYSAIRIVIFKEKGVVATRVEPLSMYGASRMAVARWWSRTQNSWSCFWKKLFSRKTR
jgi:hypothetical protein